MAQTLQQKILENSGCSKKKSTEFLDGSESAVDFEQVFSTEEAAQQTLNRLTAIAREAETEPCIIQSRISSQNHRFHLKAQFAFCCQAESFIFQMKCRSSVKV
ncbi:YfcZ/YiiS family protein [Bisgaard Taxon 10/6]|uniref:YfcZ/YiiS family protein n=1 Tax=Exercitatus varius TaxID=67857 RepID=UPI00294B1C11|nr:YfcZ/YiiS family protein [Exercitatus varius]MDG2954447.1 YfcZ/YiiS family protein [Exercitatus varius]